MRIHNYRNLDIWKKSRILVKDIYLLTMDFPREVIYGITSQIRRASISIPSNIAEGTGRHTNKSFVSFLQIALGSTYELESLIIIACDIG